MYSEGESSWLKVETPGSVGKDTEYIVIPNYSTNYA